MLPVSLRQKQNQRQWAVDSSRQPEQQQPRITCAHHGVIDRPNDLETTRRLLEREREIAIVEIDFVSVLCHDGKTRFFASHDYPHSAEDPLCCEENALEAWLRLVCLEQGRTLYIDLKARHHVTSLIFPMDAQDKVDCIALFDLLQSAAVELKSVDLRERVWLASQDRDVAHRITETNRERQLGWQIMVDLPYIEAYAKSIALGCLWPWNQEGNERLCARYLADCDLSSVALLSLDCGIFGGLELIEEFVRAANLRRDVTLVLYAFPRSTPAPRSLAADYSVIMMYDYHL